MNLKTVFILSFLSMILSCTPLAYFPSKLNPPHFSDAGNFQVSVAATTTSEYSLQTAISPMKYVGLYYVRYGHIPKWTDYKHLSNEFGGGTYYSFDVNNYVGLYGGYSRGYVNAKNNDGRVYDKFNQYSAVLVIDRKEKSGVLSGSLRLDYHKMSDYSRQEKINGTWKNTYYDALKNIYWTPSIGRTFGTSSGALQLRFVASIPTKKSVQEVYFYISGGLLFDFKLW